MWYYNFLAKAIDEAKNNVRVNIVSPGNIWTPLWKSWSDGEPDPDAAKEAGDKVQVMQRKGTIEETGRVCKFTQKLLTQRMLCSLLSVFYCIRTKDYGKQYIFVLHFVYNLWL